MFIIKRDIQCEFIKNNFFLVNKKVTLYIYAFLNFLERLLNLL